MGWYIKQILIFFCLVLIFTRPVYGEEKVSVKADSMQVLRQEGRMILEGDARLTYENLVVYAQVIEIQIEENIITAWGDVRLWEGNQYIECQELTYHIDAEITIFLEARARFHDEETGEDLFFFSPFIEGDGTKYDITSGDLTPCDLEEPHIFFRAQEVEVYPGDYLIAYNVVLWELGGLVPLFFWPVLYLSLEEDQDIVPSFGYSEERGWYIKLAYHYFSEENRGIFYLDYYSRTGLGTGFRHYYLERDDDAGFFYFYLLENREQETGWDYFQADLSHRQHIDDWRTAFVTNYHLLPEDRERIKITLNTATSWENSRLDYRGEYEGVQRLTTETWTRSLISRGNYRLSLPFNSTWSMGVEQRLLEDDLGVFQIIQGEGQLTQRGPAHTLELLLKRDRPQRYVREAPPRFTALPELSLGTNPARLFSLSPPFSRYLNPLGFNALIGRYREEGTNTEGMKIQGEYIYQQTLRPLRPLTINVSQRGTSSFYYLEEGLERTATPDSPLSVSDSRVRTGIRPFQGLDFSLDYNRRFVQGHTPFSFDRVSEREDVGGSLTYSWNTGRTRLSTSYSLLTEQYGDLKGDFTLTPVQEVRMEVSATYSIEEQAFKGMVATSRLDFEGFKHDLALRVDADWEIERVDTELLWDVGEVLEVGFRARYHPQEQEFKRGEVLLIWDLHCRQLSFSYDHLKEEYWIQYSIPAFPGQKASLGRTPEDPMLFDLDLGGFLHD